MLFSRHLTVKQQTENNSETRVSDTGAGDTDDSDYFAVHVFKGDGQRLYAPNPKPTIKGIYNNDPHTLIRFDTGDLPGKQLSVASFILMVLMLYRSWLCGYRCLSE